jgi:hypothetical protein
MNALDVAVLLDFVTCASLVPAKVSSKSGSMSPLFNYRTVHPLHRDRRTYVRVHLMAVLRALVVWNDHLVFVGVWNRNRAQLARK